MLIFWRVLENGTTCGIFHDFRRPPQIYVESLETGKSRIFVELAALLKFGKFLIGQWEMFCWKFTTICFIEVNGQHAGQRHDTCPKTCAQSRAVIGSNEGTLNASTKDDERGERVWYVHLLSATARAQLRDTAILVG